jgi:immune inhibitor A
MRRRLWRVAQVATIAIAAAATLTYAGTAPAGPAAQHSASGFLYVKMFDQAACLDVYTGGFVASYYTRGECTRVDFVVTNTPVANPDVVRVEFVGPDGAVFKTQDAERRAASAVGPLPPVNDLWRVVYRSDASWPAGQIGLRIVANGEEAGSGQLFVNALGASVEATPKVDGTKYEPGEQITVEGNVHELNDVAGGTERTGVPATFSLQVRTPTGETRGPYGPFTAAGNGDFSGIELPAAATTGLSAGAETNFELDVGIDVIDASHTNLVSGAWANDVAGSGSVTLISRPTALLLENKFVSSLGWVKPGQSYPFRILVHNRTDSAKTNVSVTVPAESGVVYTDADPVAGAGTATASAGSISWTIPSLASDTSAVLVAQARAKTASEDARIVWKDLSTTATMTYDGGAATSAESHGPKVIPPSGGFETARYGDKPFPMIPVDFRDRKHKSHHSGEALARVVNSPDHPGSTYNLYQEMSFGQLHPFGSVPSVGIASSGFDYGPGFTFTERDVKKPTCRGATVGGVQPSWGTPVYPERISDGWYQLPGDTEYYGGDFPVFTATTIAIDQACGDTSKMIFDAVQIADPEIDYNQFDSDKDGLVDFTMVVFAGCGGNGASQLGLLLCEDPVPYDNPWPHSSSLENSYSDPVTKLPGYTSDDQLTDLSGVPQCWENTTYTEFADCQADGGIGRDDLPVHVRVGPYNINPEDAIDHASVISHEYGHHLGLPDYYATSYSAYNDWNLMAADYSQHMTVFSKQELGWVVPRFLQPGETRSVSDWEEIKNDTGEIQWQTPAGQPYTLSGLNGDQNIHNGEAYALKLPRKLVIDPEKVRTQASAPYVWWSGRGNDFGCPPNAGHNLDVVLPELEFVPEGTPIKVRFKSSWDIEWDFDYGFVLVTTDGSSYTSLPSARGYSTSMTTNPNNVQCLNNFDNGLTGTSGAAAGGPARVAADRGLGSYDSGSPFIDDEYDLTEYAGRRGVVLRFAYSTDPGLDRPAWFVDDLEITAGDEIIYASDFSQEDELRLFPGGCGDEGRKVAAKCTEGWNRIKADEPSALDHAYYLELRDRSGFDFNGRGQSDRGDIQWAPGMLVEYTDEVRGYGNTGAGPPPKQHYLDSQPQPDYDCGDNLEETHPEPAVLTPPRCEDAAFTAVAGDNAFQDVGWIDNFWDDSSADGLWHFDYGCLTLNVTSMAGHAGNTEALPSDLTAAATITAGTGCSSFEYWAGVVNAAPTAVASANPKTAAAGETVAFSAVGSFDDLDAPEALTYEWAFGDGETATGAEATHAYAAKGTYEATLTVTDTGGLSDTDTVFVTVLGPDLQVTDVTAPTGKLKGGKPVTVTATVRNAGPGSAPASKTEFLLNGTTVLGLVDTPALGAGQSAQVNVQWTPDNGTREHVIRATADKPGSILEEIEGNNWGQRTFIVHGNRLSNGDFEQQTASGTPESWSGQSTGAGTASSSSNGGTDGSHAAQMKGNGGNAGTSGSPTWTSTPFAVHAGDVYDVTAAVKADGLSSTPSLGLVYLGAAGQVLDTVKVLTAPLQTDGFRVLEQSVTIPPLVAEVRVVLTGFAPTDLATRGTVTFDDVGVFAT